MPNVSRGFFPKNLLRRAEVLSLIRAFFRAQGFLEVETPVRIPVPLPEAHIEPIESEGWVLQPSPEICMKPLVAAGCERIYQICKCFRKGERGRRHLPDPGQPGRAGETDQREGSHCGECSDSSHDRTARDHTGPARPARYAATRQSRFPPPMPPAANRMK